MDISDTIVDLVGSVALLLWGTQMVESGVKLFLGDGLRPLLTLALRTRATSFLAGLGVTTLLQSSTATAMMVTGFSAGGLVELVPGLAVLLGANVGSTLAVQILSFNMSCLSPVLLFAGVLTYRRSRRGRSGYAGRSLIGFGLITLALHQIDASLAVFDDDASLAVLFGALSHSTLAAILIASVLTWLAHSSVAVVLVTSVLASKGVVPPDTALYMVLGANMGTALNPLLEGDIWGRGPASYRLPLGNFILRAGGALTVAPFVPLAGKVMVSIYPEAARSVMNFHTGFNLALALVMLPLLTPYARLLQRKSGWIGEATACMHPGDHTLALATPSRNARAR